jgi:hypothetical protein
VLQVPSDPRALMATEVSFAVFRATRIGMWDRVGWAVIDAASIVGGAARLELPLRPRSAWPPWLLEDKRKVRAKIRMKKLKYISNNAFLPI